MSETLARTVKLIVRKEYVAGGGVIAGARTTAGSGLSSTRIQVEFVDWDGLSKYAQTQNANGQHDTMIVLGLDKMVGENTYEFNIPASAMDEEGMMTITFTGYEVVHGTEVQTVSKTAVTYLKVVSSDIDFDDMEAVEPTLAMTLQNEIDVITNKYLELPIFKKEMEDMVGNASDNATLAHSWAEGGTGTREGEDENNAKYYSELTTTLRNETEVLRDETIEVKEQAIQDTTAIKEQAIEDTTAIKNATAQIENEVLSIYTDLPDGFIPMGTITFDELPDVLDASIGHTYNIKDAFTTTSDFNTPDESIPAGAMVYMTGTGKWDVLSGHVLVAPLFDANTLYTKGKYVTYLNQTYRFKEEHPAGAWNSSHVDAVYAMGQYVTAGVIGGRLGLRSTAEGLGNSVWGDYSHAEGVQHLIRGNYSHAEGLSNVVEHDYCHAEGKGTRTGADYQHVQGYYNVGKENTLFEIGNGDVDEESNAFEVDTSGNVVAGGDITDGSGNKLSDKLEVVDSELSTSSTNPVMNSVVTNALNNKMDKRRRIAFAPENQTYRQQINSFKSVLDGLSIAELTNCVIVEVTSSYGYDDLVFGTYYFDRKRDNGYWFTRNYRYSYIPNDGDKKWCEDFLFCGTNSLIKNLEFYLSNEGDFTARASEITTETHQLAFALYV